MRRIRLSRTTGAALAGLFVLNLFGCQNPFSTDGGHRNPNRVIISLNDEELLRATATQVDGQIDLSVGTQLGPLVITFEESGVVITPDDDEYLAFSVADTAIADFLPESAGAFRGHLAGKAEGNTTIEFLYMHGPVGGGHAEFRSASIPVSVVPVPSN